MATQKTRVRQANIIKSLLERFSIKLSVYGFNLKFFKLQIIAIKIVHTLVFDFVWIVSLFHIKYTPSYNNGITPFVPVYLSHNLRIF